MVKSKLVNILLFGIGTTSLQSRRHLHMFLQHVGPRSRYGGSSSVAARSTTSIARGGNLLWLRLRSLENCGMLNMLMYVLSRILIINDTKLITPA